jgi:hypothetical protein
VYLTFTSLCLTLSLSRCLLSLSLATADQPWSHAVVPEGAFSGIDDYAIKQWGGLIREYQAVRLEIFVQQMLVDLRLNKTLVNITNCTASFKRQQLSWLQRTWNATELPPIAVGDSVTVSKELQALYNKGN